LHDAVVLQIVSDIGADCEDKYNVDLREEVMVEYCFSFSGLTLDCWVNYD